MEVDSSSSSSSGDNEDKKLRRELRHKYREKKIELQENREAITSNTEQLNKELQEINTLFTNVKDPREGVLDSDLIHLIASMGKQKALEIPVNFVSFQPHEFAEKLKTFMQDDGLSRPDEIKISKAGWSKLGQHASKFFMKTPVFHYMLGSFKRGEIVRKIRERKAVAKEKDAPTTTVSAQAANAETDDQERTTEEVERVLGILHNWYKKNDKQPICYFEFITNPDSFGQTVENMFHVAFLVKDGQARVYLDDDKLPVIEPVIRGEDEVLAKESKNQVIMSISIPEWEEIVKTFQIQRPLIPPRSTHKHVKNEKC